jgi:hypothetical protein
VLPCKGGSLVVCEPADVGCKKGAWCGSAPEKYVVNQRVGSLRTSMERGERLGFAGGV